MFAIWRASNVPAISARRPLFHQMQTQILYE